MTDEAQGHLTVTDRFAAGIARVLPATRLWNPLARRQLGRRGTPTGLGRRARAWKGAWATRGAARRRGPGAVVLGGDYLSLAIVRSLGPGVPGCVVDDERSIARFSRYAASAHQVRDLEDGPALVEALMRLGRDRDLAGWVIFPTRDQTVAAIARHRAELDQFFRLPDAGVKPRAARLRQAGHVSPCRGTRHTDAADLVSAESERSRRHRRTPAVRHQAGGTG